MKQAANGIAIAVVICVWAAATSAVTDAQRCEATKLKTAGRYSFCRFMAKAKGVRSGDPVDYSKCDNKLSSKWTQAESHSGGTCPTNGDQAAQQAELTANVTRTAWQLSGQPRFLDNSDGTITDTRTGLMWEQKCRGCSGLHDDANRFTWQAGPNSMSNWISAVNAAQFAGHSDWRVPSKDELLTIVDRAVSTCGTGGTCIDPVFGATLLPERVGAGVGWYWSATALVWMGEEPNPAPLAWAVSFSDGGAGYAGQQDFGHVRAVRAGL